MTDKQRIKSMLKELDYYYLSYDNMHNQEEQGLKIIKKALEKQISVKPEAIEDKMYCCPKCNNNLLWIWKKYPIEKTDLREGLPYCLSCGQAIDWSEE